MNQELNIKNVFKAEQVRLKPYYDLNSYRRELVYAKDVLDIHISRIEGVMAGKWRPENANKDFGELVTEIRGLSRTDSTENEPTTPSLGRTRDDESPPLLEVLSDKEMTEDKITETPKLQDNAIDLEYAAAKKEGRQPNCPYCGEPLEVRLKEDGITCWIWDEEMGCYDKQCEGTPYTPYCAYCLIADRDFIDHDLVEF